MLPCLYSWLMLICLVDEGLHTYSTEYKLHLSQSSSTVLIKVYDTYSKGTRLVKIQIKVFVHDVDT